MSVSPYYEIINEFRVIMLSGKPRLIYKKVLPHVIGDGKHALFELAYRKYGADIDKIEITAALSAVPAAGDRVNIGWKHNLGQGSEAAVIGDPDVIRRLSDLSVRAAGALRLNFASIDIIETAAETMVLEINSGIMMENFSSSSAGNYIAAKAIYAEAIESYFDSRS